MVVFCRTWGASLAEVQELVAHMWTSRKARERERFRCEVLM